MVPRFCRLPAGAASHSHLTARQLHSVHSNCILYALTTFWSLLGRCMMCWAGCSFPIPGHGAPVLQTACWRCISQPPGRLTGAQWALKLLTICPSHVLVTVRGVHDVLGWLQLPDPMAWCPACVTCLLAQYLTATWQPARCTLCT